MNINKSFLYIRNRYPLLQISYKSHICKTLPCTASISNVFRRSSKQVIPVHKNILQPASISFYSSIANEEQINTKASSPAITVPPLEFADVAFETPVSHNDLLHALQICDSVDEQMFALTSTLALSEEDIERRLYFCKVIESLLKPFFGDIKIQIFGSTLNGCGFKGCDLDMSFETFHEEKEKISYIERPDVPMVSEVMSGSISPAEICLLPRKEQLLFIHLVFLQFYEESKEPTIFINDVPLIRFYHDKYGLKCDLTYKNTVAISNTKLLRLFGELDERFFPLVMTIRYWARHVELIGKGLMFNSYTIALLVIHFLQTRNDPVLPSAEYLMSLSDSLSIQDMNDTSFLQLKRHVPPSQNTQTLSELLKDFFYYYMYFDFTRVICPLIGDSVPRKEFFEKSSKKFRMNSICVQDPMDVNHNVAEYVDHKHCRKFFTEIMTACRLFQSNSYLLPAPTKWGISCLFDKPDEYLSKNWFKKISFTIPHIVKEVTQVTAKEDADHFTAKTLLYLLQHILLFECRPLGKPEAMEMLEMHDKEIDRLKKASEIKNQLNSDLVNFYEKQDLKINRNLVDLRVYDDSKMLEDFQKCSLESKLISCFECKATKNTWLGRDNISLDSLPDNILDDLVERERYISIQALKNNELAARYTMKDMKDKKDNLKKTDPLIFICECYTSPEFPESSLLLNFRPFQKLSFNPVLGIFLEKYVPKLINKLNNSC